MQDDFPSFTLSTYGNDFDHEAALDGADVVIVHEWTPPELVARIGRLRRDGGGFVLLFHDTHHRGVSEADAIHALPLSDYDAVLAFGEILRSHYQRQGWGRQVFTWHEAADTSVFQPMPAVIARTTSYGSATGVMENEPRSYVEFLIEPARARAIRQRPRRSLPVGRTSAPGRDPAWLRRMDRQC